VVGGPLVDVVELDGSVDELVVVARLEGEVGTAVFFVFDPIPHPATTSPRPSTAANVNATFISDQCYGSCP
jgi:hypothetical protein